MSWTDTHAHIYVKDFDVDREEMLTRARAEGIGRIYMPNIDEESIDRILETASKHPGFCVPMMGLHPCSVKKEVDRQLYVVEESLNKGTFAAVGEMGTDLYWDKTFWEQQKEAFIVQAGWAIEKGLPVVIHCRESIEETLELLAPLARPGFTGIFHCFTGTAAQAKQITDLGFYIGVGGVSTFKNGGLDAVLPHVPLDRLVLETDSPYLAPVPYRGKRNEPAYLLLVARRVSALLQITEEELMQATTRNVAAVFGNPTFRQETQNL